MRSRLVALAVALALAVTAACAGDDEPADSQRAAAAASAASEPPRCEAPVTHAEAAISSGGVERTFRQDVPDGATTDAPLVIGLHGYGATGALLHLATDLLETAEEHEFVFLAPDALRNDRGDFSWRIDPASPDVRFIEDLIDHAIEELCVDPARVHLTGHSQGGFFISTLACTSAERIASVAPVAGLLPAPPGCSPADPVPLLAFHDTGDRIVPYSGGLPVNLAEKLGLPAEGPSIPEIVDAWSTMHRGVAVQLETTDRYDHGWPAEANEMIWAFFESTAER